MSVIVFLVNFSSVYYKTLPIDTHLYAGAKTSLKEWICKDIHFLEILGPFPAKAQELCFSPQYLGLKSFIDGFPYISWAIVPCQIILSL